MNIFLVAACLALAGCAGLAEPFEVDEAPQDLSPRTEPVFHHTIDMTKHAKDGTVRLFAFQALAPAQIDAHATKAISYSHGGVSASISSMRMDAPVDAMLARAAGDLDAPLGPNWGSGGGGGGCGALVDPTIRVGGETLFTHPGSGCSARAISGGGFAGERLEAGNWLLVAAGSCGFGAEALDANDRWTFTIASNQTLTMIEMPPAPFACGLGFDPYYEMNILGMRDGGAAFRLDTIYGASISRGPLRDAEVDGLWHINGTTVPMDEDIFFQARTPSAGTVGFDVETSDGFGPFWTMVGL